MEKITSILSKKESHFHTISPASSVNDALCQMCCENVDHLVVMDEDKRFLGLITEHDITAMIAASKELESIKVKDITNSRFPAVTTEDTVEKCMQLMQQHHVRYLPVFENFSFKGIVSSEDILEEAVNNRMEIFDTEMKLTGRFGMVI